MNIPARWRFNLKEQVICYLTNGWVCHLIFLGAHMFMICLLQLYQEGCTRYAISNHLAQSRAPHLELRLKISFNTLFSCGPMKMWLSCSTVSHPQSHIRTQLPPDCPGPDIYPWLGQSLPFCPPNICVESLLKGSLHLVHWLWYPRSAALNQA